MFDNAATLAAARQYWIPSVTVTGQGHSVLGITMAGTPVGATPAYVGRLAGDTLGTMTGPPTVAAVTYGTTTANYNPPGDPGPPRRWGDYSFTIVDPLDDMTRVDDPGVQPGAEQLRGARRQARRAAAGDAELLGEPDRLQRPHRQRGHHRHGDRRLGLL